MTAQCLPMAWLVDAFQSRCVHMFLPGSSVLELYVGSKCGTCTHAVTWATGWAQAVGCRLLGAGSWVLAVGFWQLGAGSWVLAVGFWRLGAGCLHFTAACMCDALLRACCTAQHACSVCSST